MINNEKEEAKFGICVTRSAIKKHLDGDYVGYIGDLMTQESQSTFQLSTVVSMLWYRPRDLQYNGFCMYNRDSNGKNGYYTHGRPYFRVFLQWFCINNLGCMRIRMWWIGFAKELLILNWVMSDFITVEIKNETVHTCAHTRLTTSTILVKSILMVYKIIYTWFGIYPIQCPATTQYIQTQMLSNKLHI